MVFGSKALDNRLQVKISETQIRFFYYDHDYGKNEWDPNGIQNNDYLKEIGFITLTRPKDTGNDILDFPQNITELNLYNEEQPGSDKEEKEELWNLMFKCVDYWKPEYYSFPFIEDYKKQGKMNPDMFRCFLRCCLLDFVYEFENRGQCFGASPIYDKVRDKLRESDVYKLLSAKIQYTQYLCKGQHLSRNQEKYTYYTQKFADGLMDKRLNKVIPPNNYSIMGRNQERASRVNQAWSWLLSKTSSVLDNAQGWFYNPEEELESILEENRRHECCSCAVLKDSLVAKIRSFLYTKHAIDRAMTSGGKMFFWAAQLLMVLWNAVMCIASIQFDNSRWNLIYDNFILMIILGGVILVFVLLSGWFNDKNVINAFFPRIIVAEAAAWLTIGIAEDLVKSMLWTERWMAVAAIIAVLILVGTLLFGETKQHSPYFRRGENITKTLLVMNHSVFFALILGCVMQVIFYNNLLKTSNVLSEVVYKEYFGQVESYAQQLDNLEKSINDYGQFAREYAFSNTGYRGTNKNRNRIEGEILLNGEPAKISIGNVAVSNISLIPSLGDNLTSFHDALLDNLKTSIKIVNENGASGKFGASCAYTGCALREMNNSMADSINSSMADSIISINMELLFLITPKLRKEIQDANSHLTQYDFESLKRWATYGYPSQEGSSYLDKLTRDAQEKMKCCRNVFIKPNLKPRPFYPNLLLFHTLIVLVLAFITQLIISDKSVTEPL